MRGIDFEIGTGEVFGLLGPNGAGKTTTVEILEGYRDPDAGEVRCSARTRAAGTAWRERIGVVLQSSSLYAEPDAARDACASSPATTARRATSRR